MKANIDSSYTLTDEIEECRFCSPPDKSRILFETQNFYVMLSLGPIQEGYLLINSKRHIDCCAAIPDEISHEFDWLYHNVINIQKTVYGGSISFEHGRAGSCLQYSEGSTHCFHAHMHCIPSKVALNDLVTGPHIPVDLENTKIFRNQYVAKPQPYLFINDGKMRMFYIKEEIPKQYLRFLVANSLGVNHLWDWVTYPGYNLISSGKDKLIGHFRNLNLYRNACSER